VPSSVCSLSSEEIFALESSLMRGTMRSQDWQWHFFTRDMFCEEE